MPGKDRSLSVSESPLTKIKITGSTMTSPRVLILRSPGTNCDLETAFAFEQAGAKADRVHLNRWLEQPELAAQYQMLCLPGGFSYGDDIAAGRIFASQIRNHLRDVAHEFVAADKLVLGICNGFQILIKSGLLLPDHTDGDSVTPAATLTWNNSGMFEDRWVDLAVASDRCVFLKGVERLQLPIAHAEGKFVAANHETLDQLDDAGQLVLRYEGPKNEWGEVQFPHNPNGAQRNVAGVCDESGRVFGLMPHPERFVTRTQHPRWTREELPEEGAGLVVFRNAVAYFE